MKQLKKILYKLFKKPNVYVYSFSLHEVGNKNTYNWSGNINDYRYVEVGEILEILEKRANKEKIILEKEGIETYKGFQLVSFSKI